MDQIKWDLITGHEDKKIYQQNAQINMIAVECLSIPQLSYRDADTYT